MPRRRGGSWLRGADSGAELPLAAARAVGKEAQALSRHRRAKQVAGEALQLPAVLRRHPRPRVQVESSRGRAHRLFALRRTTRGLLPARQTPQLGGADHSEYVVLFHRQGLEDRRRARSARHEDTRTPLDGTWLFPSPTELSLHFNLFPSTLLETSPGDLLEMIGPVGRICRPCIEVSEHEFVGLSESFSARIQWLRDAGILIAIDDVCGVPGALDTLVAYEPDIVKIDRRVVHGVSTDSMKERLLGRLLKIAEVLGTRVIAEGVEHEADCHRLREMGIAEGQGFLWSRPTIQPHTYSR